MPIIKNRNWSFLGASHFYKVQILKWWIQYHFILLNMANYTDLQAENFRDFDMHIENLRKNGQFLFLKNGILTRAYNFKSQIFSNFHSSLTKLFMWVSFILEVIFYDFICVHSCRHYKQHNSGTVEWIRRTTWRT